MSSSTSGPSSSLSTSPAGSSALSPPSSLSKSTGKRLQPVKSSEALLNAHPLLQTSSPPSPPPFPLSGNTSTSGPSGGYVINYKTRQRPISTSSVSSVGSSDSRGGGGGSAGGDGGGGHGHGSYGRSSGSTLQHSLATSAPTTSVTPETADVSTSPASSILGLSTGSGSTAAMTSSPSTSTTTLNTTSFTGTSITSSAATSKLQLQNLQAVVQSLGLSNDSAGWMMLQKIISVDPARDKEGHHVPPSISAQRRRLKWEDIRSALSSGKVSILLPREKLEKERVTIGFVLDHLVITDSTGPVVSSSSNSISSGSSGLKGSEVREQGKISLVTLSGLRGVIEGDKLVLANCGHTLADVPNQAPSISPDLADPASHNIIFGPCSPSVSLSEELTSSQALRFPYFTLLSSRSEFLVPRQQKSPYLAYNRGGQARGGPSGRAGGSLLTTTSPTGNFLDGKKAGRSLVSLFAGSGSGSAASSPPKRSDSQPTGTDATGAGSSSSAITSSPLTADPNESDDASSIVSVSTAGTSAHQSANWNLTGWTIDKVVDREEVVEGIGRAWGNRLRASLDDLDEAVVELVRSFVARFLPQSTSSSTSSSSPRLAFHDRRGSTSSSGHVVERRGSTISATDAQSSSPPLPTLYLASFEEVQNAIQDMYEAARKLIEDAEKKRKSDENGDGGAAVTATEDFEDSNDLDGIVDRALERIEDEVCLQLYDQLFCPPSSEDASADDNLASRIAGLHMLDLSFDHLGLQLEGLKGPKSWDDDGRSTAQEGLEEIVKNCGVELEKLQDDDCRCPKDKLSVLVTVHRIIVEGLSMLPPIPIKEDLASEAKTHEDVELDDTASSSAAATPHVRSPEAIPRYRTDSLGPASPAVPEIKLPEPSLNGERAVSNTGESKTPTKASEAASKPASTTSYSADLILPILIYCVVQSNPQRLASHLTFIQRCRAESLMRGEAGYCLVNFHAVCEFVEHVDMTALGLSSDRVLSFGDLSPSPLASSDNQGQTGAASKIREMVSQEVGSALGSANKVFSGVMDGGYRMFGRILGGSGVGPVGMVGEPLNGEPKQPRTIEDVKNVLAGAGGLGRARGALLRRASTPLFLQQGNNGRERAKSEAAGFAAESRGTREMVEVNASSNKTEDGKDGSTKETSRPSSLLTREVNSDGLKAKEEGRERSSSESGFNLAERFASIPVLGRFNSSSSMSSAKGQTTPAKSGAPFFSNFTSPVANKPSSRRSTLMNASSPIDIPNADFGAPSSQDVLLQPTESESSSPVTPIAPPLALPSGPLSSSTRNAIAGAINRRWLECSEDDLKVSEITTLLDDYKKLVALLGQVE